MTFFAAFADLSLVNFSTCKDIDSIAIHRVLKPISVVYIIAIEKIETFSLLLLIVHLSQVHRSVFIYLFDPFRCYVNVLQYQKKFLLKLCLRYDLL